MLVERKWKTTRRLRDFLRLPGGAIMTFCTTTYHAWFLFGIIPLCIRPIDVAYWRE